MSVITSMTDAEAKEKTNELVKFIDKVTQAKIDEIDAKAEDDFNMEKSRQIQTAHTKIIDYYERKIKVAELQKKIQQSNLQNSARLQVFKRKEELVQKVFEEARHNTVKLLAQEPEKYRKTMIDLTCQALAQLLEPKVTLQVKQADLDLIKSILPEVADYYKRLTKGQEVRLIVDETNCLSPDLIGGVKLTCLGDKITVNNTLDERLKQISVQLQPQIRETLFGANPNRKFKD